ncbi:MAG: hypothetical protein KGY81_07445, partial [Phycisphaerae bacterium]|nr:hypothetical protein [Phycisphaerae bacterium]
GSGKPILTCPEEALEQRLNAHFVDRWEIGMAVAQSHLTTQQMKTFLASSDEFKSNMAAHQRDGLDEAWQAIRAAIDELTDDDRPQKR